MELINATRMVAGYAMGIAPSGRESLIVVIKGTFCLPKPGEEVRLHEQQLPLIMADTFTGEPGFSAPYCEVDFAPSKQRCDVLLQGSAYAPHGQATTCVEVALRIGSWMKTFAVVGERHWQCGAGAVTASAPQPFAVKAISYDNAFGGTDLHHQDPAKHAAFMRNPVGCGFHAHLNREWLDGSPLPCTQEIKRPIDAPDGDFAPMAFGPVGRGWEQRSRHAGTYDQQWLDQYFPFLPPDFDAQYYQAAPLDQQLPVPVGAQQVTLVNLTADGERTFMLPHFAALVHVFPKKGEREDLTALLDTIMFEPDHGRFTLTWRVSRALRKNMFEIAQVLVGRKGQEWWQQREEVVYPIHLIKVQAEPGEPVLQSALQSSQS
jgi:hypothetical protein